MKKNVVLVVALLALIAVGVSAQTGTAGLKYDQTADKKGYSVSAGTVTSGAVVIPASYNNLPVTTIADNAFINLKITSVTIPNSITSIGLAAFSNCTSLTSVTIPKSVINMGQSAFGGCTSLTSVTFEGTFSQGKFHPVAKPFPGDLDIKFYEGAALTGWAATYTRPSGSNTWTRQVQAAAATAGDPESDFKVTKSGNAITITQYVGKKTSVNIPSRIQNLPVTSIGDNAFQRCTDITGVTIPNGITVIGTEAFDNCISLKSITIPNSVKSIEDSAFNLCTALTSVTFSGTIPASGFDSKAFKNTGDIRTKFYATDKNNGTAGTYTRPDANSTTWTKK